MSSHTTVHQPVHRPWAKHGQIWQSLQKFPVHGATSQSIWEGSHAHFQKKCQTIFFVNMRYMWFTGTVGQAFGDQCCDLLFPTAQSFWTFQRVQAHTLRRF